MTKKHGMSSEKASRVKRRGHNKEYLYSAIIQGEVVKGTKKEDIKDKNDKIHSLKGGSEIQKKSGRHGKWQIFLYKKSRFENEKNFLGRKNILQILDIFPSSYQEYQNNKLLIKEKIKKPMIELKQCLANKRNKYNFIDKSFFDQKVNYFVIYEDDAFYVFDRQETINTFVKYLKVDNNRTFQKVVFKYNNKLLAELEYRTTNDGKYPAMLFNMQKRSAFDLLSSKIKPNKQFQKVIFAFGNAIDYFEKYPFSF